MKNLKTRISAIVTEKSLDNSVKVERLTALLQEELDKLSPANNCNLITPEEYIAELERSLKNTKEDLSHAIEVVLYFKQGMENLLDVSRKEPHLYADELENVQVCHGVIQMYSSLVGKMRQAVDIVLTHTYGAKCNYYLKTYIQSLVDDRLGSQTAKLQRLKDKLVEAKKKQPYFNCALEEAINLLEGKEIDEED